MQYRGIVGTVDRMSSQAQVRNCRSTAQIMKQEEGKMYGDNIVQSSWLVSQNSIVLKAEHLINIYNFSSQRAEGPT